MSEPVVIDALDALELLREVVEDKEDFVYWNVDGESGTKACRYFIDGQPSCLVGHALVRAGVVENFPLDWNAKGVHGLATVLRETDWHFQLTVDAANVFMAAQECQDDADSPDDRDHSWGKALQAAEEMYQHVTEEDN